MTLAFYCTRVDEIILVKYAGAIPLYAEGFGEYIFEFGDLSHNLIILDQIEDGALFFIGEL